MSHATIAVETPFESLIVEQALAFARQMESTANGAKDGTVLDQCETLTLTRGREFLRTVLAAALQQQAVEAEKKGGRPGPVHADTLSGTKGDPVERS